jgi:DNA-binding NtrC family response regulator
MSKTILIIDDEESIRELLKLEFTDLNYDVFTVKNAFDGLNHIKEKQVDLVILDVKMPGMDGIEALEKIISIKRDLPIVIHSAYSHYKENYLTWSATSYVVKSSDLSELKTTVNGILLNK